MPANTRTDPSNRLRPHTRGYARRRLDRQPLRDRLLIVCEGTRTEPAYFQSFPVTSAHVEIVGLGMNTLTIVQETIRLRDQAAADGVAFQQAWSVFDRDSFPLRRVHAALELARQADIRVALSNEAFELWPLLHFGFFDAALSRRQYADKLSRHLRAPYRKNDPDLYHHLAPHLDAALQHADTLARRLPALGNPSTTVPDLVRELLRLVCR